MSMFESIYKYIVMLQTLTAVKKVNSKSYIELPSRFYHRHDH